MTLSELINQAAADGLLKTLSLYGRDGRYQANAERTQGGWQCVPCTDPAEGLEKAVRGLYGYSNQPDKQAVEDKSTDEDIFG